MADRALHPSEIEAILRGDKHLPGVGRHAMRRYRAALGMGPFARPMGEGEIELRRLVAYAEICPHDWREQPVQTLEYAGRRTRIYSGVQTRHCPLCGTFHSRMWTVNGYATEWQAPVLPVRSEV